MTLSEPASTWFSTVIPPSRSIDSMSVRFCRIGEFSPKKSG